MTEKTHNPVILAPMPDTPHPRSWTKLATAGDVRRFFRWLLLEVKKGRVDSKKANSLAFIGGHLLRAIEVADLEQRIAAIEAEQDGGSGDRTIHITVEGRNDET